MGARLGQPKDTQRQKSLPAQPRGLRCRTSCLQAFVIKEIAVSQGNSTPDEQ